MLILEGPDGAGKTTLAQEIVAHFDIPLAEKVVRSDTTHDIDLAEWVENNLEEGLQWMLFDRHRLISEPIYGTVMRNFPSHDQFLDLTWMTSRMQQFYDIMPLIIYCLPPLGTVISNVMNDPDNTVVADKIPGIYAAYVARASIDYTMSPGNVILWDYTTAGQTCGDELVEAINQLRKDTHNG